MSRTFLAILLCLSISVQSISATQSHKPAPPFSTGMYLIESPSSGKLLQTTDNGLILLKSADSDPKNMFQRFYLKHAEGNTYYLLGGHNRKIIEVTADGSVPQERRDFGFGHDDRWSVSAKPEGGFSFQHILTGKYLAVKDSGVHMVVDDNKSGTLFKVHKHLHDGVYSIKAKDSSHYLHFENNRALLRSHDDASTAGKFYVKAHGPSHFSIVDFKTNHALTLPSQDSASLHLTTSPYTEETLQKLVSFIEEGHFIGFQSSNSNHKLAKCQSQGNNDGEHGLCLSSEGIEGTFELIQELDLPLKRYNERAYLSTHNSYASTDYGFEYGMQPGSITYQLENGVRSVNLDIWDNILTKDFLEKIWNDISCIPNFILNEPGIYVFHNVRGMGCIKGVTTPASGMPLRLYPFMQEIVDWLKKNPKEIVHIEFEDDGWWDGDTAQGPNYALLVKEFAKVDGLYDLVYSLDYDNILDISKTRQWPLVSEMISTNKRLILFPKRDYYTSYTVEERKQLRLSVIDKYINGPSKPIESEPNVLSSGLDYSCTGFKNMTEFSVDSPLFKISHIRQISLWAYSYNENDFFTLWSRAQECMKLANVSVINTFEVDWFTLPFNEPLLVIKKLNDPSTPVPTRFAQCKLSYQRNIVEFFFTNDKNAGPTCDVNNLYDKLLDQCAFPICPEGWDVDPVTFNCYRQCPEGTSSNLVGACTWIWESYTRDVYNDLTSLKCQTSSGRTCDGDKYLWYPSCNSGYSPYFGICTKTRCPIGTKEQQGACIPEAQGMPREYPNCTNPERDYADGKCVASCIRNFESEKDGIQKTFICDAKEKRCPEGFNFCGDRCVKNGDCNNIPQTPSQFVPPQMIPQAIGKILHAYLSFISYDPLDTELVQHFLENVATEAIVEVIDWLLPEFDLKNPGLPNPICNIY